MNLKKKIILIPIIFGLILGLIGIVTSLDVKDKVIRTA
jgi:hypothetical protein